MLAADILNVLKANGGGAEASLKANKRDIDTSMKANGGGAEASMKAKGGGAEKGADWMEPDKDEPCECAIFIDVGDPKRPVCSSEPVVQKIADILNIKHTDKGKIIEDAKRKVGAKTESELLTTDIVRRALGAAADREKELRMKPHGPANSTEWFSNDDIDKNLAQWSVRFKHFKPIPFQFINFLERETELAMLDLNDEYKRGIRCIGCILNSASAPPGKHWMATFIDMRAPPKSNEPWSVEFFNSSGNPPVTGVVMWMLKMAGSLSDARTSNGGDPAKVERVVVSRVKHQQSNSECGPYCMYYIWSRLKGKPWKKFSTTPIPDAKVTKFRTHLFRVHE